MKSWTLTSRVSQLKVFLRTLGYYRKFIPDFATLETPLFQLEKKGRNFWGPLTVKIFYEKRSSDNMADALLRALFFIVFIHLFWTQQRQVIEDRSSNLDYRGYNEVSKTNSSLRQQFRAHFFTPRGITSWPIVKRKFGLQRNRVTALKKRAVKDFCTNAASTKSCPGLFWKKSETTSSE